MTLIVILATLVVQGATLLPLVRWLKVGDAGRDKREEAEARELASKAGVEAILALRETRGSGRAYHADLLERLESGELGIGGSGKRGRNAHGRQALLTALQAQREVVDSLRDCGRMGGALAEQLDTELDLDAIGAEGDGKRLTDAGQGAGAKR